MAQVVAAGTPAPHAVRVVVVGAGVEGAEVRRGAAPGVLATARVVGGGRHVAAGTPHGAAEAAVVPPVRRAAVGVVVAGPLSPRARVVREDAAPPRAGDDGEVARPPFPAHASEADGAARPLADEAGAPRVPVEGAPQTVLGGAKAAPETGRQGPTVGHLPEAAKVALGGGEAAWDAHDLGAVLGRPPHPTAGPTTGVVGGRAEGRAGGRVRVAPHRPAPRAWRQDGPFYWRAFEVPDWGTSPGSTYVLATARVEITVLFVDYERTIN